MNAYTPYVVTFDDDGSTIVLDATDPQVAWEELQKELGGEVNQTSATTGRVTIDGHTRTFTITGGEKVYKLPV